MKKFIPQSLKNYYHLGNALIANTKFGFPARKLKVIGVTGTDGKTTTSTLIYHILKNSGKKVALITSVAAYIGDREIDIGFHVTTPDPWDLQKLLKKIMDEGYEYVVLESTSHGFDQYRLFGIPFYIGVLTNITHEHLDYHKTYENYVKAKSKLFKTVKIAILNKEDKSFTRVKKYIHPDTEIIAYTQKSLPHRILTAVKEVFPQDYNILNATAAILAAEKIGVKFNTLPAIIKAFKGVPGRMEHIKNNLGIDIIVDFAHTPNALKSVLTALKRTTKGRLISVFGCASERDVKKRPLMGSISVQIADISIFTAEDPRYEDINKIIGEIAKGAVKAGGHEVSYTKIKKNQKQIFFKIPERGEAIALALHHLAQKGDTVVICGKGHEMSMSYEGVEHPWNDISFVNHILDAQRERVAIILAGGKGTRFNSPIPKNLHKFAGRPMLTYELENLRRALFRQIIVVVGFGSDMIRDYVGNAVTYAVQQKQLGTGHAALCGAKESLDVSDLCILYGDDGAFYGPELFSKVYERHTTSKAAVTFVSVKVENPYGFGRVVYDKSKRLIGIVEEKDADEKTRKINEVNDGVYVVNKKWFLQTVPKIKKKSQGEYLLTDIIEIALKEGKKVEVYKMKDTSNWFGINTPEQLQKADKLMRDKILHLHHA